MAIKKKYTIDLTIDFETRSELDLRKVGPVRYAKHKSTEVICMSYKFGDRPTKLWWPKESPFPKSIIKAAKNKKFRFVAHNAFFEQCIFKYVIPRYIRGEL